MEQSARRGPQYDFDRIAADIRNRLSVSEKDVILDVCCGNGALTKRIAVSCRKITGVDFSLQLLERAKKIASDEQILNIEYQLSDVLKIDGLFSAGTFDKIYCYFSFQYFNAVNRSSLLKKMKQLLKPGGMIFIGDVPDRRKKWNFYPNKFKYYRERISHLVKGREGECDLGWWIGPNEMEDWCASNNLECKVLSQEPDLPHAHYRFDVLIRKESAD